MEIAYKERQTELGAKMRTRKLWKPMMKLTGTSAAEAGAGARYDRVVEAVPAQPEMRRATLQAGVAAAYKYRASVCAAVALGEGQW